MTTLKKFAYGVAVVFLLISGVSQTFAETNELRIARQYGLGYLQLIMMEDQKLVEKHAKASGLGDIRVSWHVFGGGSAVNDALISGNLDFATAGIPPVLKLWSRTRRTPQEVKGVLGVNVMPMLLTTRSPQVKTIKDFTEKNKIALTGVKIAIQAIILQMAAAQAYGAANFSKLDPLTVTMSHPDAMAALLSGKHEVDSHFASPPFQYLELERPGIHVVLNSADVVGPVNLSVVYTTAKFHDANPRAYAAFLAAFREATELINKDKRGAVELYVRMTKSKETVEHTLEMLKDAEFTMTPQGFMKFADFMHRIGTLKTRPDAWRDVFFPEVHQLPGS